MNVFSRSISSIFKGAVKSFQAFPTTIACALALTVLFLVRVQLDWPRVQTSQLLFNSLGWALVLGALSSLALITAVQSRLNQPKAFLAANLLGAGIVLATFLALFLPGGTVSGLAASRIGVLLLVSFLAFIVLAAYPKDQSDFARSFFMTHKAFLIALIYGLVIMGGLDGVTFAIKALIFPGMSEKVNLYILILTGFLAFTLFVGYFPDFRKGQVDAHREVAQKQPRFIEILLGYILIPIVMALTVVLLAWAGRTVLSGIETSFVQLAGIATAYTVGGIWLHVLVTHYETGLAKFYRRAYPYAALVILAFEAWALLNQLNKSGLKMTEYSFIIIWIIALFSAVTLIFLKARAQPLIVALASAMAIISVLPAVGYQALPFTAQASRLEKLLLSQDILQGDQLVPAVKEPEQTVREQITDAVTYLSMAEDLRLPAWYDQHLNEPDTFKAKLGFAQQWPGLSGDSSYASSNLVLPHEAVEISDYRWVIINPGESYDMTGQNQPYSFTGDRGTYQVSWISGDQTGNPSLLITLDGRQIIKQDFADYLAKLAENYPPTQAAGKFGSPVSLQAMSVKLSTAEIEALVIFSRIEIYTNPGQGLSYYASPSAVYFKEN